MSLYYENPANVFSLWSGERLATGALYPTVIENSWDDTSLNEIKLYKPVPASTTIPSGKMIGSTSVKRVSGVVKFVNTFVDKPEEEPALPGPPVLRACTLGLRVKDGDFEGIPTGYNVGGVIYLGVGTYLMFFINPIPEPYEALFITDGPYSVSTTTYDEFSMLIEVKSGEVATDPNSLSVQVYQR